MTETVHGLAKKIHIDPDEALSILKKASLPYASTQDIIDEKDRAFAEEKFRKYSAENDSGSDSTLSGKPRLSRRLTKQTTLRSKSGSEISVTVRTRRKRPDTKKTLTKGPSSQDVAAVEKPKVNPAPVAPKVPTESPASTISATVQPTNIPLSEIHRKLDNAKKLPSSQNQEEKNLVEEGSEDASRVVSSEVQTKAQNQNQPLQNETRTAQEDAGSHVDEPAVASEKTSDPGESEISPSVDEQNPAKKSTIADEKVSLQETSPDISGSKKTGSGEKLEPKGLDKSSSETNVTEGDVPTLSRAEENIQPDATKVQNSQFSANSSVLSQFSFIENSRIQAEKQARENRENEKILLEKKRKEKEEEEKNRLLTQKETAARKEKSKTEEVTTTSDEKPGKKLQGKGASTSKDGSRKRSKPKIGQEIDEIDEILGRSSQARTPGSGRRRSKKQGKSRKESPIIQSIVRDIQINGPIASLDLAKQLAVKSKFLEKTLKTLGVDLPDDNLIDPESAALVIEELGHKATLLSNKTIEDEIFADLREIYSNGVSQTKSPVVTVMGHVDHGKTSLLDFIRKSQVTKSEAGGITQHIGAYRVKTKHGPLTFLDTPGHEDFSAMRARGASLTDIVILVVAANDGVMPQTEEALSHAKNAEVPIVVAVNKMDIAEPGALENIKKILSSYGLTPEEWGGETQFVPVSALKGDGVNELLEAVALQSELLELTGVEKAPGSGYIIESKLDKGAGPRSTILITNGTARVGDILVSGTAFGKVKALIDEDGKRLKQAGPSFPAEMLGFNETPEIGQEFLVVKNEKIARDLVAFFQEKAHSEANKSIDDEDYDPFSVYGDDDSVVLNILLKADVKGTLEALEQAVSKIKGENAKVAIIHKGIGGITESDANLAKITNAIIVGFNVRASGNTLKDIEKNGTQLRYYKIIHDLVDDLKQILSGMLTPDSGEEIIGTANVRDVFNSHKFGQIAGCMVTSGSVQRNKPIRVLRDDVVIYEGSLESLRRVREDVDEVRQGIECGIGVKNYQDVRPGDVIEVFKIIKIPKKLQ